MTKKKKLLQEVQRYLVLFIGSIIYAAGLEILLVPNNIIDSGIQ